MMQRMLLLNAALFVLYCQPCRGEEVLRAGIVGCDTSHAIAFTDLINSPTAQGPLAKVQVTAVFPGGSPDIPSSSDRVGPYTEELRGKGLKVVDSIAALLEEVDVILLESVDGRVHLDQFRQLAVGKPVFIDKPAAGSLANLLEIFRIAQETGTPCFSSSALRYNDKLVALKNNAALGQLTGCSVASPFETEPHHPDLFWYGVHGIESVYTLMGVGCETVSRVEGSDATVVVGKWNDGRLATYRGLQGHGDYAFTAFGTQGMAFDQGFSGYGPLITEICQFFLTRKPPISPAETIEMFAFMEAADESLKREGRAVPVKEIITRAERQLEAKTAATP